KLFGRRPQGLELRFLTPAVLVGRSTPTPKRIARAEADIEACAAAIREGRFPASPAFRACSYCAYAAICPSRRSE
ncbi:MAG: PD-(D/E)XK nuclease family protein, partial [Candidatus Bipolaricaulis sp.]|nr:PD-(D/E)XK nuclease family protein [Candidatus Bipolaricaulis sp.]